jgi:hypothetical protein
VRRARLLSVTVHHHLPPCARVSSRPLSRELCEPS